MANLQVSSAKGEVGSSNAVTNSAQSIKTTPTTESIKERSESTKTKVVGQQDATNSNKMHDVGVISQEKLNRALSKPGKKYPSVYASAPFKTEMGRQRPASSQYRKSYTLKNKNNVKVGDAKSRPMKSSEKLSASTQVDEPISSDFNTTSGEANVVKCTKVMQDIAVAPDHPDIVDEEAKISDRLAGVSLSDITEHENSRVGAGDEEKLFLLVNDG